MNRLQIRWSLITASETVWKHDASIQEGNNLWGFEGGGGAETLEIVKKKKAKGNKKARKVGRKISLEVKVGGASFVICITLIFMMNISDLIIFINRMRFRIILF